MSKEESYFTEFRKGEVTELQQLLRNSLNEKNVEKQKESVRKVIAYMTLGIDVSSLFVDMTKATITKDLIQKKLVYMYLSNYAESNKEASILAVNTLLKDCVDQNPMVRGLSLKSLSSLRLPTLLEYIIPQVKKGLLDQNSYVRKIAVIGCLKIFYISPSQITQTDIIDKLYDMLRDREPSVISNVVSVLNEILVSEGGMAINKSIVIHLLSKLKYLNEWSQCEILKLISKYTPEKEDLFDFLNILDTRLKHANPSVVFAAIKVFINFVQHNRKLYDNVMLRIKAPLLTILSGASSEIKFTAMKHISLLLRRAPRLFDNEYKSFFCGFSDPSYLKEVKLEVLEQIANKNNMHDIISELSEYVKDIDVEFASRSIIAISKISTRIPEVAQHSLDRLLSFLQYEVDIVSATTILALKDILRKYPNKANYIMAELEIWVNKIEDPEPKAAIVWMMGEFGDSISGLPYILEDLISKWNQTSPVVKMQLLTASMKVFFKRPGEMQPILGQLFVKATLDSNIDVHDRAYLYYRALKSGKEKEDFNLIQNIFCSKKNPINNFSEDQSYELTDQLFDEFDTLSVIYGKPEDRYLKFTEEDSTPEIPEPKLAPINTNIEINLSEEEEGEDEEGEEEEEEEEEQPQQNNQQKQTTVFNLIDL